LRQPWAYCAVRDGKPKSRAGRVRPVAAERRVLGLPKPNPPLERPFPPEFNRVLYWGVPGDGGVRGGRGRRGGEGNPEWSRLTTLGVMGRSGPGWAYYDEFPRCLNTYRENVTVCQGRGAGVFCAVLQRGCL
jgi:hypothetical protein